MKSFGGVTTKVIGSVTLAAGAALRGTIYGYMYLFQGFCDSHALILCGGFEVHDFFQLSIITSCEIGTH
jgi:hypothetical protein